MKIQTQSLKLLISALLFSMIFNTAIAGKVPLVYLSELSVLQKTLTLIRNEYIESDIDDIQLIESAVQGLLKGLNDPYSRFVNAEQFKLSQEELNGAFGGVGMMVTIREEKASVISPMRGTPAFRAGILPGDYILSIDGESTEDADISWITSRLRGEPDTTVEVEFKRGEGEPFTVDIVREMVKVHAIDSMGKIEDGIGYVRIATFNEETARDLEEELLLLKKDGVRSLVVDLRNNPGGLLDAAVEVAQLFLDRGEIVSVRDRDNNITSYTATSKGDIYIPIAILINRGSASAAEILTGAIKDNHRGIVIGEKSFGKGCVQSVIPYEDGSAVILTTGWYYTPSGICIHDKGISPDISVDIPDMESLIDSEIEDEKSRAQKDRHRLVVERERGEVPEIIVGPYDTQLQRAVELLKGAAILTENMSFNRVKKNIAEGNR